MKIDSVFLGYGCMALRVFARIGAARFEYVRLSGASELEVYDFPKAWRGLPRFCGYAPKEVGDKLASLARTAAMRVEPFDWTGKTIDTRGAQQ